MNIFKNYTYIFLCLLQSQICFAQTFKEDGKIEVSEEQAKKLLANRENWLQNKKGVIELHTHGASYLPEVFYPFSEGLINAKSDKDTKELLTKWKSFLEDNIEHERYGVGISVKDDQSNLRKTIGSLHHASKLMSYNKNKENVKNVAVYFKATFSKLILLANSHDHEVIGDALYILQLLSPASMHKNARWFEDKYFTEGEEKVQIWNAIINDKAK